MRRYKQVKEKKVIYSLDEWKLIEERAASVLMKTGTFIRQMSLDGQITFYSMGDITQIMNALRIIGGNINQIAKKANEINNIYAEDIEKLQRGHKPMPYIKSISIHSTVERSLAYILDPEKTDGLILTNSMNCIPDPKCAYLAMKTMYEHFSGYKFDEPLPQNGKGRVKAIHYIQSFDPKDKITSDLAHKIGRTLARKAFGDHCQVVIATHIDKGHLHNHIIINTYGIDGKKFNANKKTLDEIKEISDRVCLAFEIQPFDKSKAKRTTAAYNEWQNEKRGMSWKQKIRNEIDRLISWVKNVDELLAELEYLGYTVKRGKYISVKAPDQQRAVHLKTLGEDYTIERLASRILWRDVGAGINNPCKYSVLRNTYNSAISNVQTIDAAHPTLEQLGTLLTVINRDNLQSIGELDGKIEQLKYELEKSRQEVNIMETKCNFLKSLAAQAEEYFALMEKSQLTSEEQLRAKMYKETLAQQNIESISDYEYLKGVITETEQKASPVKAYYNKCDELLREYSDIANTYNEISQGDYIGKIIEQQQKKNNPQIRPRR